MASQMKRERLYMWMVVLFSEMIEYDYDSDGVVDESYSYSEEYDADGNLISEMEEYDFDGDGVADEYSYYTYEYDEDGNVIFEGYESEDESWSYSYDSDGNTLSMLESEDIVDEYISEYEYNEDGSLSSVYDGWDDTYYEYDENGNLTTAYDCVAQHIMNMMKMETFYLKCVKTITTILMN